MIKSKSIRTILFFLFSLSVFSLVFYGVMNLNKPVTIVVDGMEIMAYTTKATIADVLEENDIVLEEGDVVHPSVSSDVQRNQKIVLERVFPVKLSLGNIEPYEINTVSKTVGDFIREQGIEVKEGDIIEPSLETVITPGIHIIVKFVDVKVEQEQHEIPYETSIIYNHDVYEGIEKVVQEGKNGIKLSKIEKKYENGVEVSKEVVYEEITLEPSKKIVEVGTKKKQPVHVESSRSKETIKQAHNEGNSINFLGKEYKIVDTMQVVSTAFYNSGSNGNHTTATGNPTVYNPQGWSTIAVDPRVIPLNTRMYVEGYGFGIAHDTGGLIKGKKIDVFMPDRTTTYNWGYKKGVKIYILE